MKRDLRAAITLFTGLSVAVATGCATDGVSAKGVPTNGHGETPHQQRVREMKERTGVGPGENPAIVWEKYHQESEAKLRALYNEKHGLLGRTRYTILGLEIKDGPNGVLPDSANIRYVEEDFGVGGKPTGAHMKVDHLQPSGSSWRGVSTREIPSPPFTGSRYVKNGKATLNVFALAGKSPGQVAAVLGKSKFYRRIAAGGGSIAAETCTYQATAGERVVVWYGDKRANRIEVFVHAGSVAPEIPLKDVLRAFGVPGEPRPIADSADNAPPSWLVPAVSPFNRIVVGLFWEDNTPYYYLGFSMPGAHYS